jgi:hypothetical protein
MSNPDLALGDARAAAAIETSYIPALNRAAQFKIGPSYLDADKVMTRGFAGSLKDIRPAVTGLNNSIEALHRLGIASDGVVNATRLVASAFILTRGTVGLLTLLNSLVKARSASQTARAAAETTAHIAAQNYAGVAFAVSMAVLVAGSFGAAYAAGRAASEKEIEAEADISTSMGRRSAEATIIKARGGMAYGG